MRQFVPICFRRSRADGRHVCNRLAVGHKTLSMTDRYVSHHVDALRAAADVVTTHIAAVLMAPAGPPAQGVPLRTARNG